jgi:hypothetical protein
MWVFGIFNLLVLCARSAQNTSVDSSNHNNSQ